MESRKEFFVTATIGVIQIMLIIIQIADGSRFLLFLSFLFSFVLIGIIVVLLRKIRNMNKAAYRFELVQYLFHNDGREQMNLIPKLILLLEKENISNPVEIEQVVVRCTLYRGKAGMEAEIQWEFDGVRNRSSGGVSEYCFLTCLDGGEGNTPKVTMMMSGREKPCTCHIDRIKSSNGIEMLKWGFPKVLNRGERLTNMCLERKLINSFDLEKQDIIYLFPSNYGQKIDSILFVLDMPEEGYEMELIETGRFRNHRKILERSIGRDSGERNGERVKYVCSLEKKSIHMENLYYILYKPTGENVENRRKEEPCG